MFREFSLLMALLFMSLLAVPRGLFGQQETLTALPLGVLIPKVVTSANPQQSYALYLPSKYSPAQYWPIVFIFDPVARGPFALAQFQQAAELHGFIVAASNNSRNGAWAPEVEAADAMFRDLPWRFSIDRKRVYLAGFSGGARVAAQIAQLCKCVAGVFLSGAGFPPNSPPSMDSTFAVFSAVGNSDFNYREMIPLQEKLEQFAFPRWIRVFDGPHRWAPPEVVSEGLAWFRLQSIKDQREQKDSAFLAAQFAAAQERASAFERSGAVLDAWREYRQVAATFDSLADVHRIRSRAESLGKEKSFHDATKRERDDFEEQERLAAQITAVFSTASGNESVQPNLVARAMTDARELRLRAQQEKKPERQIVLKRAVAGAFVTLMESGEDTLEKKNYLRAAQQFACASEADPESEWAVRDLALARALSGDRKGAVEALRSVRKLTKDPVAFFDWLAQEPAFGSVRSSAEFRALVER